MFYKRLNESRIATYCWQKTSFFLQYLENDKIRKNVTIRNFHIFFIILQCQRFDQTYSIVYYDKLQIIQSVNSYTECSTKDLEQNKITVITINYNVIVEISTHDKNLRSNMHTK